MEAEPRPGWVAFYMDPNDPAHFHHYDGRIDVYYNSHPLARKMATEVLGALSRCEDQLSESQLWDKLVVQLELSDRRLLQTLLESLSADHYITRRLHENERYYRFRYDLIRRWWSANRA